MQLATRDANFVLWLKRKHALDVAKGKYMKSDGKSYVAVLATMSLVVRVD